MFESENMTLCRHNIQL